MKKVRIFLGVYFTLIGIYMLLWPIHFYESTPGVSMMGPYNSHFIRDVSFAFIASGLAIKIGTIQSIKSTIFVGALWPFMHAIFHINMWIGRDFIVDRISVSDFLGVVFPGLLIMFLAIRFRKVDNV